MAPGLPEIASNPALTVCACTRGLVSPSSFLLSSCSKSDQHHRLTPDRPSNQTLYVLHQCDNIFLVRFSMDSHSRPTKIHSRVLITFYHHHLSF